MICSRARGGSGWACEPFATVTDHQLAALRSAVVVEDRLDPLLPLCALLAERVAQPDTRAQVEDVLRRDP